MKHLFENIASYREGIVTNHEVKLNCCSCILDECNMFSYIELIYQDGSRHYIYEDEEGYQKFEHNFVNNRFTSFHEFFTTEELAVEKRGDLSLKYYVRRDPADYTIANLAETLKELADYPKTAPRMTTLGHYDRKVNYHEGGNIS
ncbi:MAG: hypothetical protein MR355_02205 [Lachnospiraceae bacterium]|nr:hypothetical protein [Lachnospiraceae bacterium]